MKRVTGMDGCKEVDGSGGRAHLQRDGTFHLSDVDAKRFVTAGGFYVPDMNTAVSRAEGYRCTCGFGSWFKTCSRCGGTCEREA